MDAARRYRTRLFLRIAVGLAALFWFGVLVLLLSTTGASDLRSVLTAAGFVTFFAAFTVVYGRTSITVTPNGIVATTPFRRRPVRFDEIHEIVVQDGLAGRVYAVFTRRGLVQFTSLFERHRELFETLLERTQLQPRF
jgi:hypothetical protein